MVSREGATLRESKQARVSCTLCGVTVAALYLKENMKRQNGISTSQARDVKIWGGRGDNS